MAASDDLDDKAAQLRARSQHLQEKSKRRREALEWAQQRTAAVEGSAASSDGLIRATVDATGMLTRLELSPLVRKARVGGLSEAITAVVQAAVANLRSQVKEVYVGLLDEGMIDGLPSLLDPPATENVTVPLPSAPSAITSETDGADSADTAGGADSADTAWQEHEATEDPGQDGVVADEDGGPPPTWLEQRPW
jgi:DNA-binding protein YbaB